MFRRRRRDGENSTGPEPGAADYPAAEDELTEQEYDDPDAGLADGYGEDDLAEYEEAEYEEADLERSAAPADDEAEAASSKPSREDLGDPATWTRLRDSAAPTPAMLRSDGPWDGASEYPATDRIDFGSLLVPVREGFDVQIFMSEEEGISIAVVSGDSGLQLQPFAAPRSSGLWHEVLPEIADEVAKAGGRSREQEGPFGPELYAVVVPQGAGDIEIPEQPLRFLGADGPRWFLRGLISGPAASNAELARPFEDIFADVVVVRGEHAEPQRKPLEIKLPDEAREVLESQIESQQAGPEGNGFNPFERGPEITEIR